jgi:hypothetical protein
MERGEEVGLCPTRTKLWAAAMLVAAGCGVQLPAPQIDSVAPSRGWNGEQTPIRITGHDFYPQVVFDAGHADQADLDQDFTAFLVSSDGERIALGQVAPESYEIVDATVDPGLDPGTYGLEVVGPTGKASALTQAFTVSDTRADNLTLDSDKVASAAGDAFTVTLSLRDPDGEVVLGEDVGVELLLTSLDGSISPTWSANALDAMTELSNGNGIRGGLGPDGQSVFFLTLYSPATVELTAAALDPELHLDGDERTFQITPAGNLVAVVTLPSSPFVATAGVPFEATVVLEDLLGNRVTNQLVKTVLVDACGAFSELVTLDGTTQVFEITPTVSTGADGLCPNGRQEVLDFGDVSGASPVFTTLPGPTTHFLVDVVPPVTVHAGRRLNLEVQAQDDWGNRPPWSGTFTWSDLQGGNGPLLCAPGDPGEFGCAYFPVHAGTDLVLEVDGSDGTSGISGPFTVLSGLVPKVIAEDFPAPTQIAGLPFEVQVLVGDKWGNLIDAAGFGPAQFSVVDPAGAATCEFQWFDAGIAYFSCTAPLAGQLTLTANGPQGLSDTASTGVTNGEIASMTLSAPSQVTAGDGLVVTGTAFDAFGNPYVVQADPVVDLADASGSWSIPSVNLDPAGKFALVGSFTTAGVTRITASQHGVALGTSGDILVLPGPVSGLSVEPLDPWAWVGAPVDVAVETIDSFGNVAPWDGTAVVESRLGAAPMALASLVDGTGITQMTWSSPVISDLLDATALEGLIGTSRPLHAAFDCANDPVPSLTFNGSAVGRACFDPAAGWAALPASFAGSVSTGPPFAGFALAAGGIVTSATTQAFTTNVYATGRYDVRGLVVQSDGCGAEISTTAWVGPDDLEPVGPLAVTAEAAAMDIGVDTTLVHVTGALDCTGAIAAGGTVFLRADRGDLTGTTPTGSGLSVVLDALGDGVATLDATGVDSGGTAWIGSWVASGAAAGETTVDLVGDDRRPTVWGQTPSGGASGLVDAVRITFSEPLRPESVMPGSALLSGPSGPIAVGLTLEDADSTLVITPTAPVDASLGAYVATATTEIRDAAGNKLDGASIGAASPWSGSFGAVAALVDPVACVPAQAVFRPDGDDGAGEEADAVSIAVSSATVPAWWVLTVSPALSPGPVRVDRIVPMGPDDTLTWDGRDAGGRVVDDGTWQLAVTPLDSAGNAGPGCVVAVAVDNPEVIP